MRLAVLTLVGLLLLACGGNGSRPAIPTVVEPTVAEPAGPATNASTKPFAVNPDPGPPRGNAVLLDVRVATHLEDGGFDCIVFQFEDSLAGAEIEYVDEAIACGSGQRVPSPSSAILLVRFQSAQVHDDRGKVTAKNRVGLFGPALLQAMQICDFEGELSWALGGEREEAVRGDDAEGADAVGD